MLDERELMDSAQRIRLVVFDVDGVFTDGSLYYTDSMMELRAFHVHDGLGIKLLLRSGIQVAVISARESALVAARMNELGVNYVYQGVKDKLVVCKSLLKDLSLQADDYAYVGDDLPDLAVMQNAGLRIAVANAQAPIVQAAHWRTSKPGGQGAVREVCELVLKAQNKLDDLVAQY